MKKKKNQSDRKIKVIESQSDGKVHGKKTWEDSTHLFFVSGVRPRTFSCKDGFRASPTRHRDMAAAVGATPSSEKFGLEDKTYLPYKQHF